MLTDELNHTTTRQCRACHQELPLDAKHFHRHCRYRGGFRWVCRPCRSQLRKEDERERVFKATKTLLLRTARDIIAGRYTGDHIEVISILSSMLGGARGVAKGLHALVACPRTPARTQTTILLSIVRMNEHLEPVRQKQEEERRQLMNQLSIEDLNEYAMFIVEQLLQKEGLKAVPIEGGRPCIAPPDPRLGKSVVSQPSAVKR